MYGRKRYRWTEADVARVNNAAVEPANVERRAKNETGPAYDRQASHPRYRIHVHSRRRRLADPDGICAKWAIDGLVRGGLLPDDSAHYVDSVTHSQEQAQEDQTVIEVWEI